MLTSVLMLDQTIGEVSVPRLYVTSTDNWELFLTNCRTKPRCFRLKITFFSVWVANLQMYLIHFRYDIRRLAGYLLNRKRFPNDLHIDGLRSAHMAVGMHAVFMRCLCENMCDGFIDA